MHEHSFCVFVAVYVYFVCMRAGSLFYDLRHIHSHIITHTGEPLELGTDEMRRLENNAASAAHSSPLPISVLQGGQVHNLCVCVCVCVAHLIVLQL